MSNPSSGLKAGLKVNSSQSLGDLAIIAQINTADPAGMTELDFSFLSLDSSARLRVLASAAAGSVFTVTPSPTGDMPIAAARVVSPGAGAAIVTIAAGSLAAGFWEFVCHVFFDGAVAAAELNNFEFREGAAVVTTLLAPVLANVVFPERRIYRAMDGATAVSINATGAGTVGIGYNAQIGARRLA